MRVIGLAVVLAISLFLAPLAADAQSAGKVHHIGALSGGSPTSDAARYGALRLALRDLGYTEGQNIVIEYRYAGGRTERLPGLAADLVRLNVDLILTAGDLPLRAAREATKTIPIVVALIGDLVGPGYVASLARPGGNITGLSAFQAELSAKRLELLKAAFPSVARVAFLWNPDNALNVAAQRETEGAATALQGIQLLSVGVRTFNDLESAFRVIPQSRADALMTVGDAILATYRAQIVGFAAKHRLPAMYGNREFVELGGLMSYASDPHDMYKRAAIYVDKILKGAKPANLPVEQPTKFELVINLKTAKMLGLTIPQSILVRADEIIR